MAAKVIRATEVKTDTVAVDINPIVLIVDDIFFDH